MVLVTRLYVVSFRLTRVTCMLLAVYYVHSLGRLRMEMEKRELEEKLASPANLYMNEGESLLNCISMLNEEMSFLDNCKSLLNEGMSLLSHSDVLSLPPPP